MPPQEVLALKPELIFKGISNEKSSLYISNFDFDSFSEFLYQGF
ncbi:hypothetical protein C723_0129 [Christiangramia flava JLT2011]|nr:hypothetical protein C723_0129 [Christiangramia flava JLT2011]